MIIRNRFKKVLSSFHRIVASRQSIVIFVVLLGLSSCYNEPNILGGYLIPPEDTTSIQITDTFNVSAYTIKTDTLISSNFSTGVLGCYNDNKFFGSVKSDFFTRVLQASKTDTLALISYPRPEPDSLVLTIKLKKYWGEKNKSINVKVYELTSTLDTIKYFNGLDTTAIKEIKYNTTQVDTPTVYSGEEYLRIRFTKQFARKLINASADTLNDYFKFMKFLKGLYFTSDNYTDPKGVLYSFDVYSGLKFTLYYMKPTPKGPRAATFKFILSPVRFAQFKHDNSKADPAFKVNQREFSSLNDATPQDTVFYIEGLGGARGLIKFDDIKEWKKKMPIAINRAELRFGINDHTDLPADSTAKQLYFYNYRDYDSKNNFVTDYTIYDSQISTVKKTRYNKAKQYYSIDVTIQLQNLISGRLVKNYIYLEPVDYQNSFMYGLYRTGNNSKPIKLIITYTKL